MIFFCLGKVKIFVEFSFIAVCAVLSAIGDLNILMYGFLAVMLHEMAHLISMVILGMKLKSITFHGCGIRICPEQALFSYWREFIILLSGPVANIIAYIIIRFFSCDCDPELANAQLVLGILNLLPCRRLDGGAAICCIISMSKACDSKVESILKFIFIFTPVVLIIIGFFIGISNFTYYVLMCYLLLSEFFK